MGVLQPILLRKVADQEYEIVAGERRFRAAQRAGLLQVPVLIKEITDRECLEIGLVENIQRSNLSAVEEAKAYQKLIDEFGLGQKEIAERVGKSRAAIANYLRILSLPQELLQQVEDGTLSVGHAKAILSIKEPSAQLSLARKALRENLSVRALEELISRVVVLDVGKSPEPRLKGIASSEKKISFPEIEEKLRRELGTKVSIRHHRTGKGKIEVSYFSEEELARIVERLC
jgi:ParB family chromosome partitioning protein